VRAGSDHLPFLRAGIPVGGIYTGGPELKTRAQARRWGGRAGQPRDPCYHRFCDDLSNVDAGLVARMANVTLAGMSELAR
jgi:aminopeptidase S